MSDCDVGQNGQHAPAFSKSSTESAEHNSDDKETCNDRNDPGQHACAGLAGAGPA